MILKRRCLKCTHIIHLNLICMSYDQKKGRESNSQFDSRPQIPWKKGSNEVRLERAIHHWKDIFKGCRMLFLQFQKENLFEKDMNVQSFGTTRVSLGSPREKWHLDVVPMERYRIYYREGSGCLLPKAMGYVTTRNFGFCNCLLQLKFSCMQHMQLQICVVA